MAGTISFTLGDHDIVVASRLLYRRRVLSWRGLRGAAMLLLIVGLTVFALTLTDGTPPGEAVRAVLPIVGGTLLLAPLFYGLGYASTGRRALRLFRQQRVGRGESRFSWSADALQVESATGAGTVRWSDFHSRRVETVGAILSLSDAFFYFLPRRCFTAGQWDDFAGTVAASGGATAIAAPARSRGAPGPWRLRLLPTSPPGRVAVLWIVCTALYLVANGLFPEGGDLRGSRVLFMSGTPVIAGLLASWALGLRSAAFRIVGTLLTATIAYLLTVTVLKALSAAHAEQVDTNAIGVLTLALVALIVINLFPQRSLTRRLTASLSIVAAYLIAASAGRMDYRLWEPFETARVALHLTEPEPETDPLDAIRAVPADRLWGAQPGLVARQVAGLRPERAGARNVYAVAVAASGVQQLFGREAARALQVAAARFGADDRGGILLSNGVADFMRRPLATNANLGAALDAIGGRIDRGRDVAFVYLVSHGGRDAALETDLPTYDDLTPISADSVAAALAHAGIRRRVIVVSACYAGSWIPALADDDTIVVTAARRDRTSFGCDDSNRMTDFGAAFLDGPLARGASLHAAFDAARATVARREARGRDAPSEPQVAVGRNMRALWDEAATPVAVDRERPTPSALPSSPARTSG